MASCLLMVKHVCSYGSMVLAQQSHTRQYACKKQPLDNHHACPKHDVGGQAADPALQMAENTRGTRGVSDVGRSP
jgi:hypothetical protein